MQQPLLPGTILQKRYRLTKTIGQGGFGRTYLAQDQARFNELCVLKEYNPGHMGTYALEKSKELFQREAQVLYQIQHPQIPQFRATFEEGKRLFLVQDYVEGKTYSLLIAERIQQGATFCEAEVVEFLGQMLPVLEHIHSKGIIHRDISPDNIILRQSDRLPVLIDFGVVKEGAVEFSSGDDSQGTTVGKIGYSPNEQLRTGKAYPNSDLYALGVTAVVMMTGKKPQDLLDQTELTWRWHQWVPTLSSWFSQILNRMLSAKPNNRYQSATEVAQALRSLSGLVTQTQTTRLNSTTIEASDSATRIPQSTIVNSVTRRPTQPRPPITPRRNTNSILNNPSAFTLFGGIAIFLVILAPVMLFSAMFPANQLKSIKKTPILQPSATPVSNDVRTTPTPLTQIPEPTPNSTPQPINQSERLSVQVGETNLKQGSIKANEIITYVVPAKEGQQLNASLTTSGVVMTLLAPNKELLNFQAKQVPQWQGVLPLTGDYYIQLSPGAGVTESNFQINIGLTVPTSSNSTTNSLQAPINP